MIGLRNRTVMINERASHEGQTVATAKPSDPFKLARSEAYDVVLESNGKQYQLKLHTAFVVDVQQ